MNRTQIYLHKSQMNALRALARKQRVSISEAIRGILREKLQNGKGGKKNRETLMDVTKRINVLGRKGPPDLASNMDTYLYGKK